jgi:hypothetical protein
MDSNPPGEAPAETPAEAAPAEAPAAEAPKRTIVARYGTMALALALLAAGVSVAVLRGNVESPNLDTLTPSDAVAFVQLTVKPEGAQRDALRGLLSRVPEAQRNAAVSKFEDTLDRAARQAGLSYRTDIKPWVGAHFAVAARAPSDATPRGQSIVGLIQVTDDSAARDALQKAAARAQGKMAFEISDHVAYVSVNEENVASFKRDAAANALDTNADYRKLRDKTGDGLMFAYFEPSKLSSFGPAATLAGVRPLGLSPSAADARAAVALRVESDGIAIVGNTTGTPPVTKTGAPDLLEGSAAGLLGAFTIFDPAGIAENALAAAGIVPSQLGGAAKTRAAAEKQLKDVLGLDLDADILPWLHGEVTVLLGGITPTPDIAAVIAPTDTDALVRTIKAIQKNATKAGARTHTTITPAGSGFNVVVRSGRTVVVRRAADRLVIASNDAYAATLLKDASPALRDDAVYRGIMGGAGTGVGMQIYVRIDRVRQVVEAVLSPAQRSDYESNIGPFLRLFDALGIRSSQKGGDGEFRLKLTFAPK